MNHIADVAVVQAGSRRPAMRGDEEELFNAHHRHLLSAVARTVTGSHELIEDACQGAWLALLRCQPERTPGLFGWLRTVAIHQAYRLYREQANEAYVEDLPGEPGWERVLGSKRSLDDGIEARRALAALAALPALQRHDLSLVIGGYSYREIAERAGPGVRSVNNVNKRLTKARARIRRLEAAA